MASNSKVWWFITLKGILMLAFGSFLIFRPETAAAALSFYIGLILISGGIVAIWNTHNLSKVTNMPSHAYFAPLVASVSGLVLLFFSEYALTIFALSIGLWVLFDGIDHLRMAHEVGSMSKSLSRWLIFFGLISLFISVLIFLNPYSMIKLMTIFFGIILVLSGGFLLVLGMNIKK